MKKDILGLALLFSASFAGGVWAAGDVTVFQENKKFAQEAVTIKAGQTVTFSNKDPFTHNVFSSTPGMSFELKTQKPGESSDVKFDKAGEADVRCAIHPQMKMKVKVQ
jgi:plastocyanin